MGVSVADLSVNVDADTSRARDELGRFAKSVSDTGDAGTKMGVALRKGGDDAAAGLSKAGGSADDTSGKFKSLLGTLNPVSGSIGNIGKSADKASGKDGGGGLGFMMKTAIAIAPALAPLTTVATGLVAGLAGIGIAGGLGFGALALAAKPAFTALSTVTAAQTAYNTAVQTYGPASSQAATAQKQLTAAQNAAGPGAAFAAASMANFTTQYQNWAKAFQPQIFGLMGQGLGVASTGLTTLNPLVIGATGGMKNLLGSFQTFASSPALTAGFDKLGPIVNQVFTALGPIITNLLQGIVNFANAAAPLITSVLGMLNSMMKAFAGLDFDKVLGPLIANFTKLAPIVGSFLQSLVTVIGGVLKAIGPIGVALFTVIAGTVTALMPVVKQVGVVIAALAPILGSVAEVLAQGLGTVIKALAPVLTALLPVFVQLATVLGGALSAAVKAVAPALAAIAGVLVDLLKGLGAGLAPAIAGIGSFLSAITPLTFIFVPLAKGLQQMAPLFSLIGQAIGQLSGPLLKVVGAAVSFAATVGEALVPAILTLLPSLLQLIPSILQGAMAFDGILVSLTPILPIIAKIAGIMAEGLAVAIVAVVKVLTPFIPLITELVLVGLAMAKMFELVGVAMGLLDIVMDANPIVLVALAAVAVVAGFIELYDHSKLVRDIIADVGKAFSAFASLVTKVIGDCVTFIKTHWELLVAILMGPFGLIALFVKDHLDQIVSLFSKLPGEILNVLGDFLGTIFGAFLTVQVWLTNNLWNPVISFFTKLPADIYKALGDILTTIWHDFLTVAAWFGVHVELPVLSFFGGLPAKMLASLGDIVGTVFGGLSGAWNWIKTNVYDPIVAGFKGLPGDIASAMSPAFGVFAGVGKSILNTIIGGLNSVINTIDAGLGNISFMGFGLPKHLIPDIPTFATGGIANAVGGGQVVRVAEAGMNEAIVPLPDGRSIPVTMSGDQQSGGQYVMNVYPQSYDQSQLVAGFRLMEMMGAPPS